MLDMATAKQKYCILLYYIAMILTENARWCCWSGIKEGLHNCNNNYSTLLQKTTITEKLLQDIDKLVAEESPVFWCDQLISEDFRPKYIDLCFVQLKGKIWGHPRIDVLQTGLKLH